jgi:putative flippase GtrA
MSVMDSTGGALPQVLQRPGVRQFVKFCIVGFSSTLIDFGVYLFLIEVFHLQRYVGSLVLARPLAQSISFSLAVGNGFIWNNRWTFRGSGRGSTSQRFGKFFLTNIIGLALNLTILTTVAHNIPPSISGLLASRLHDPAGFIGKVAATTVVVSWNFLASKYWTFKS